MSSTVVAGNAETVNRSPTRGALYRQHRLHRRQLHDPRRRPWFVLETTGSAAKTGLTAVAVTLPQMLAGFFANAFVDRFSYRRASIVTDLTAGCTVVLVPFLFSISPVFRLMDVAAMRMERVALALPENKESLAEALA